MADKTQKIFDEIVLKMAEVVKLVNEDMEDPDTEMYKVDNLNDEISNLTVKFVDVENNFLSFRDLDKYCKNLLGSNYFGDRRCWSYLHDSLYDVFYFMNNVIDDIDESMQTGLGMMQQLPTNSVYDGELDDLYNGVNKKMKKLINGLSVDDACDIALESNFDIDGKEHDENITIINKVSDAWETYKKSWKKFNKEYLEKDFFETIAYLKKNGLFNKKANDVIDGWMDDIEQIFYSDTEPNKMELNFGFSGNDIFELKEKLTNKRLKEKKIDEEDRIEALEQLLGLDEEDKENIEVDDETLTYDSEEYLVVTEDEGYEMAKEDVRSLLEDDLGLEGVSESTQEYAIENFCNFPWKDDMHESNLMYAQDIDSENGSNGYASRLVEEAIDEKVIKEKDCFENEDGELDYEDKDELAEMLADKLDENYDSMREWFESIYGSDWAREMQDTLKDYIDWEALAEYVVDSDGVANTLARWDGQEHEEKVNGEWFYIYRTN
jgi:hypothetical protein